MDDEKLVYVYVLIDPRDSKIRYVGSTINIQATMSRHSTQFNNKKKVAWIDELRSVGLKPKIEIIDTTTTKSRTEVERRWIQHHVAKGDNLLNGVYTHEFNRDAAGLPRSWHKEQRAIAEELGNLLSKYEEVPTGAKQKYNVNYLISRAMQIAINTLKEREPNTN